MKVILLKDVAKVGQHGTMKEVSDGYALNFLIPRGLAVQGTPDKVRAHMAEQKREGETKALHDKVITEIVQDLQGARVEIYAKTTEKGGLFKSITATDIVRAIEEQKKAHLPVETIALTRPIKEMGDHVIPIAFGTAKAEMTLAIIASA